MNCVPVKGDGIEACANCGKLGGDTVKLKDCKACRLVKYCGVDCQRAHRKQHKKACKQRAAELKDEKLYSQGHERPEGDFCPICTLPIPLSTSKHSDFWVCCMKRVCHGCVVAAQQRGMFDCPFCRTPMQEDNESSLAMVQKRVDAKDPVAMLFLGDKYYFENLGLEKDVQRAIELWTEAAKLGLSYAHHKLGNCYFDGEVAEDHAKAVQHWKKAAMRGNIDSRNSLGVYEVENGNYGRAARHYLIAAKMGESVSLNNIKEMFVGGIATKEHYAEALKGYWDSVEEMKSQERDEAKALVSRVRHNDHAI